MNRTKAQELFSAYRDGTLEPGLKQQLELLMASDSAVAREYREFDALLSSLEGAKSEEIEVPMGLRSRIADLIDAQEGQRAPTKSTVLSLFDFRKVAFGAAAALAILATVLAIRNGQSGDASTAGIAPSVTRGPELSMEWKAPVVELSNSGGDLLLFRVRDGIDGPELSIEEMMPDAAAVPLQNNKKEPQVVEIELDSADQRTLVLPGTQRETEISGTGTILDVALAIAKLEGKPVEVKSLDKNKTYTFTLRAGEVVRSVADSLRDQGLAVSANENGFYLLTD